MSHVTPLCLLFSITQLSHFHSFPLICTLSVAALRLRCSALLCSAQPRRLVATHAPCALRSAYSYSQSQGKAKSEPKPKRARRLSRRLCSATLQLEPCPTLALTHTHALPFASTSADFNPMPSCHHLSRNLGPGHFSSPCCGHQTVPIIIHPL